MAFALQQRERWCLTGVAGFIGSHLLEELLRQGQEVVGLDNLRSGRVANLEDVRRKVAPADWTRFRFVEGDVCRPEDVATAVAGADRILHGAALVSVPQSIADPLLTHAINVTGFVHVLDAARAAGAARVVYASSSAVYGDCHDHPAREERLGTPLSPYAATKRMNEDYAGIFERCYGLRSVGLRYFNIFGPRQDPAGAYAAVIPRWIEALRRDQPIEIFGDGETSRDFCPVRCVVEANLRAATCNLPPDAPRVFNVGLGRETTLNSLAECLRQDVGRRFPPALERTPRHGPFRAGDIRHSRADLTAAGRWLGYSPDLTLDADLDETVAWHFETSDAAR